MELDCLSLASSTVLGLSLLCNWISLGSVNWATMSDKETYLKIGLWKFCIRSVGASEVCRTNISSRVGMLIQNVHVLILNPIFIHVMCIKKLLRFLMAETRKITYFRH